MTNIRRYSEENAAYFVTTITKNRAVVFKDPKYCRILLITIEYFKIIFEYSILGYCMMPDHVHLIIRPSKKFSLSYVMQMIKGSFTRKINKLNNNDGHLWQRRFYDQMIMNNRQLLNQLDYIHNNPVKDGLATVPCDYPFSSYQQYHEESPSGVILEIDRLF